MRLDYNTIDWFLHFYHDESSPSGLRWNRNVVVGRGRIMYHKHEPCLAKDSYGYWVVSLGQYQYKIHRILWIMSHGYLCDDFQIDHFDRNKRNNKISNLRVVEQATNNRNSSKRSHNTTGYTGVTKYYHKPTCVNYYKSKVTYNGKQYIRIFNVDKLGELVALEFAKQWRIDKLSELRLNGADFTNQHGLDSKEKNG